MKLFRTLVALSTVGVIAGCAAPPAPDDNPYYTTTPSKPRTKPEADQSSGTTVSPLPIGRTLEVRPLPQTVIVPGKTLPASPVAVQPAAGLDISRTQPLDLNRDGHLTTEELLADGVERMLSYDRSGDDQLNQAEFLQAMGDRRNRFGASTNLFKHLDINRDNLLSRSELEKYLSPSISALDKGGDGVIRSLSPIPPFPDAEDVPAANTVVAGLPRLARPGALGPPVKPRASNQFVKRTQHVSNGAKAAISRGKKTNISAKGSAARVAAAARAKAALPPKSSLRKPTSAAKATPKKALPKKGKK